MGRLFGTDGIRGLANSDLSIDLAMNIGRAAATVMGERMDKAPTFLLAKDTRLSGDMLESAMTAGLCSAGANVISLGILPTPAVAHLVRLYHADAGIMLSASHNPYAYNGIKIFGSQGYKLADEQENEIEEIVLDHVKPYTVKAPNALGRLRIETRAIEDYITYLTEQAEGAFPHLRVAVDCANGSAGMTAPELFTRLGVDADIFHAQHTGCNINENCGSTHIRWLSDMVRRGDYQLGIAFDGDADRLLVVDENGTLVDGDQLMAIFAYALKNEGKLKNDTVVATVMSNLGLFKFGEAQGIHVAATKVGDRYVLEEMLRQGHILGGEQSGHIIFLENMTTGDGQLSAVQLLKILRAAKKPLSELASLMQVYPQTLINLPADQAQKDRLELDAVKKAIAEKEAALCGNGRVLVRASGTEPLVRVMVEGETLEITQRVAKEIETMLTHWDTTQEEA